MKISKTDRGYSPFNLKRISTNHTSSNFIETFEGKLNKLVSQDIDTLISEVYNLDNEVENNFKEEHIERYKDIIKKLILKTQELVKVVEKISGKNKDKILKVVVISDTKLKKLLDEVINSEISKLRIKGILKELNGILISLKV